MEPITSKAIGRWRRPGFLLEPLGWVQGRLAKAFEAEPTLVELLFDLDQSRMHLTALALAHMTGEVTPDLVLILLQGSSSSLKNLTNAILPARCGVLGSGEVGGIFAHSHHFLVL